MGSLSRSYCRSRFCHYWTRYQARNRAPQGALGLFSQVVSGIFRGSSNKNGRLGGEKKGGDIGQNPPWQLRPAGITLVQSIAIHPYKAWPQSHLYWPLQSCAMLTGPCHCSAPIVFISSSKTLLLFFPHYLFCHSSGDKAYWTGPGTSCDASKIPLWCGGVSPRDPIALITPMALTAPTVPINISALTILTTAIILMVLIAFAIIF